MYQLLQDLVVHLLQHCTKPVVMGVVIANLGLGPGININTVDPCLSGPRLSGTSIIRN